jgi:hypothetical protein
MATTNLGMGRDALLRMLAQSPTGEFQRERVNPAPIQDDELGAYLNEILNWQRAQRRSVRESIPQEVVPAPKPRPNPKFQRNIWDF